MQTLIIHDNEGYVVQQITGGYRVPIGIPYLEIEIPEGKQVKSGIGVDVSVTPPQAILEDIPKTEVELLKEQVDALNIALAQVMGV